MITVQRLQRGKMMSTESTGHRIWVSRADFSLLRNPQNLQLWPRTTNSSDWRWNSWQLHKMTLWYENLKLMQQRSMYFGASCGPQVKTSYPCPTMLCMPRAITFTPGLSGIVGWSIYASIGSHHSAAVLPSDSVKFHHVESYHLVI